MLHDDYETTVDWWVFVFPKPDKVSLVMFSSPTSFVVWTPNLYFSLWEDFVAAIKTWSFITNISHESHLIRATKHSSLSLLYLLASSTLFGYFFEEISSVFTVPTGLSEIPLYTSLYKKRTLSCERIRPWVCLFIFKKLLQIIWSTKVSRIHSFRHCVQCLDDLPGHLLAVTFVSESADFSPFQHQQQALKIRFWLPGNDLAKSQRYRRYRSSAPRLCWSWRSLEVIRPLG